VTLFIGKSADSYSEGLFKINATDSTSSMNDPQLVSTVFSPEELTLVSNKTACFTAYESESMESKILYCTDGISVDAFRSHEDPFDLFAGDDGKLWFRQYRTNNGMIYSLNPDTMETTFHTVIKDLGEEFECDEEFADRRVALFSIFVGIIPTLIVSLFIWFKLYIPTMPITTYFSATWFILVVQILFPSSQVFYSLFDVVNWWFVLSSGFWLLALFLFYLTNRVTKTTLTWTINFTAVVFFISMFVVTEVFSNSSWLGWIIINVVSFAPLIFVGVVSDQNFLIVLGAIGIFVDVGKIGASIGNGDSIPVYFLLFGVSGIGLGYFGLILNKYQQVIQSVVKNKAESWLGSIRKDSVNIIDTEMAVVETGVVITDETEKNE